LLVTILTQYIISAPGCDGESPGIVPGYHEGAELYFVARREDDDFPSRHFRACKVAIHREGINELESAIFRG